MAETVLRNSNDNVHIVVHVQAIILVKLLKEIIDTGNPSNVPYYPNHKQRILSFLIFQRYHYHTLIERTR